MKKIISACVLVILVLVILQYVIYSEGWYIDFSPNRQVSTTAKTTDEKILIKTGDSFEELVIKGVDLDASIPGHKFTEFAIDKETYLRWFSMIQDMGANTIRVYTIMDDTFYNSLYEYNTSSEEPLYLLQGLWVNDYANNSSFDALSSKFYETLQNDALDAVDIIHGNKNLSTNKVRGSGIYRKDISDWVLGYILGLDWNAKTIAYTNNMNEEKTEYSGDYFYTTKEASAFETMLAKIMDKTMEYESKKYKEQRLISFINNPSIDPFTYDYNIAKQIDKFETLDFENICATQKVISGYFASYQLYDYCPEFSKHLSEQELIRLGYILHTINTNAPYYGYVELLNKYHSMPVIITGYGFSSSRGNVQAINDGDKPRESLNEIEQGNALKDTYLYIIEAGSSGAIITSWQDTWSKHSSNTMHAVDINYAKEWSDYQTSNQYYGLLSFDPGENKSICYIDGDISEWNENDLIINNNGLKLFSKYDEKFIYFMVEKNSDLDLGKIYIPIDITPKSGSNYCEDYDIKFEHNSDFILILDGEKNSRLLVHERYDVFRANYLNMIEKKDPYTNIPQKDTPKFNKIYMLASGKKLNSSSDKYESYLNQYGLYETGLLTHGNANPESPDYNSLADFHIEDSYIEIKIPWQLLNFSLPSRMLIHDDYYEKYGVENLKIKKLYIGVATDDKYMSRIPMNALELKGWKGNPSYHERLKKSYYIMKEIWDK